MCVHDAFARLKHCCSDNNYRTAASVRLGVWCLCVSLRSVFLPTTDGRSPHRLEAAYKTGEVETVNH